ncbi:AGAP012470-PA [Anopheles gambiae str. PEST]|uniref:AGAP012470-PA n=1 Tax=Anopheles gambiae TaxID=7165 RepID=A0NB03_ANOGA|nr:AGAP012470-PA [Anopheles gambiae str. PEST]
MKQIICAVLFGLLCSNSAAIQADQSDVLRNDNGEIETKGVVQSGRLVNGIGVRIERYKFAVSLRYFNQYVCGASIITPSHALTSAFCATKYLHVNIYGSSASTISGGIEIPVVQIVVHPSYVGLTFGVPNFDVAVVIVPTNAFQGTNMAPIALQSTELPVESRCYLVGWGETNVISFASLTQLRYASMNIVSQSTCTRSWYGVPITSERICARYCFGVDACRSDIGSPLVCNGKLTGFVSITSNNCDGVRPAIFTKVAAPSIRSFIRNQTGI